MSFFGKPFQTALRKIRSSDSDTKKKWVMILTGVATALVLGLWVLYLNLTLPSLPNPSAATSTPAESNSIFRTLGRGWDRIKSDAKKRWNDWGIGSAIERLAPVTSSTPPSIGAQPISTSTEFSAPPASYLLPALIEPSPASSTESSSSNIDTTSTPASPSTSTTQ